MTAPTDRAPIRLHVLNPGGNDPEQHFAPAAGGERGVHAPVNFHAYAACTGGSFFRDAARAARAGGPVLLLLRDDFRTSARAFDVLKKTGVRIFVSLKETGLHQIAAQLEDRGRLERFTRMVRAADGCIAPTAEAADIYRWIRQGDKRVAFIATPYPLHDSEWNFSHPLHQRDGIFVGTREWDIPSRNHAAALIAAKQLSDATGARVTVYNFDGRKEERLFWQLGFARERAQILRGPTTYRDYLRVLSEHRIVWQLDTSFVPGQVAGDALLARMPCVGGNGAIDKIAHANTCGAGRSGGELAEIAARLLRDPEFYEQKVADSQGASAEPLSFATVAMQLAEFLQQD